MKVQNCLVRILLVFCLTVDPVWAGVQSVKVHVPAIFQSNGFVQQQALTTFLTFFPKPSQKMTANIFHQIAPPNRIRSGILSRLTSFAITSNIPFLSYGVGWIFRNRKQTQETEKILAEVKTALLQLNEWPPHIQKRIHQTRLWVMDKADTHGKVLYGISKRPIIVLNSNLVTQMTQAQLIYVLGHELAHPWFLEMELSQPLREGYAVLPGMEDWMFSSQIEDLADQVGILALRSLFPEEQISSLAEFFELQLHSDRPRVKTSAFPLLTIPSHRRGFPSFVQKDSHKPVDQRVAFLSDLFSTSTEELIQTVTSAISKEPLVARLRRSMGSRKLLTSNVNASPPDTSAFGLLNTGRSGWFKLFAMGMGGLALSFFQSNHSLSAYLTVVAVQLSYNVLEYLTAHKGLSPKKLAQFAAAV